MTAGDDTEDVILRAEGLTKHFAVSTATGGARTLIRAVDGVSLAIRRGETLAIVGESGCGKSTVGRLLLRLLEPTDGAVFYQGRDITRLPARAMRALRRDLQFVFQDPYSSLNPRMTVGALLEEPLLLHRMGNRRERRERVASLMATMGLGPHQVDRYPHEFSGGQRQRIGIARALVCGPKLVIGDEPVSALDVSIQAQIINLLQDLQARLSLTLVVISHDLAVVRHMSDRIAVMYLGRLVEVAPTAALFERPLHPYTRALIAAIPLPFPGARAGTVIEGDIPSPAAPPPGCRFHTRCPFARARCRTEVPAAEPVGPARTVACHFWREIEAAAAPAAPHPTQSATRSRRLALFKKMTDRQKAERFTAPEDARVPTTGR